MKICIMLTLSLLFLLSGCTSPPSTPPEQRRSANLEEAFRESPADSFSIAYVTGKFDPLIHSAFTTILPEHANQSGLRLRADAYAAFVEMFTAAKQDGIQLRIISATRNFERQKLIWEKKWTGATLVEGGIDLAKTESDPVLRAKRILRYSSMPGTSRHHWGTDIDLNHLENDWFEQGEGLKVYTWLVEHAASFGFCQPYSPKGTDRPYGYEEEKWHWSWMPVARSLTRQASTLLKDEDIQGFLGDQTATQIGVVEHYILGVNNLCK
ncbi:MAG: M15 family metallopeptidase [Saprospiraceae bacterium]|nr:M15 family metallopeptidase [Saprospiraceae bacterium]